MFLCISSFNTQPMHIYFFFQHTTNAYQVILYTTALLCFTKKKYIHPGGIRTRVFSFLKQMRENLTCSISMYIWYICMYYAMCMYIWWQRFKLAKQQQSSV
jgi:hypothetical protein